MPRHPCGIGRDGYHRHRRRRLPIANGLALAAVLDDSPRVTVVCFGDGATNTGAFHEAVNLAAVWTSR